MKDERDASRLPIDWADALRRHGFDRDVDQLLSEIYESDVPRVFPPQHQVFRAFHLTKIADVRVVILGQDPYPQEGQANGLAFSFDGHKADFPRSLKAIYDNADADDDVEFHWPDHGDLSPWAKQGVLLLNSALTVREDDAGSDVSRWKDFTDSVLHVINEECSGVVFLLWGSSAIRKAKLLHQPRHKVVRSSHPTPRGRTKETPFNCSRPFSDANAFLANHPLGTVNWSLTADH